MKQIFTSLLFSPAAFIMFHIYFCCRSSLDKRDRAHMKTIFFSLSLFWNTERPFLSPSFTLSFTVRKSKSFFFYRPFLARSHKSPFCLFLFRKVFVFEHNSSVWSPESAVLGERGLFRKRERNSRCCTLILRPFSLSLSYSLSLNSL